ncbi:hypothetical protein BPS10C_030 [Bacillus phage BPS10C]|uniref:Uncharacterized protein n=1 Tax=Bacillus phage BPS10C TaxID=1277886 RepID=W5QUT2_9CAUD|nr:hypothetical protein BPS10C_030 [Bacillus phage BPS10C]AGI12027.1 hypothetical protein BPS10C_030 [Bacillus phage BPS10C]
MSVLCKLLGHKLPVGTPFKPTPVGVARGYFRETTEVLMTIEQDCQRCGEKQTTVQWFKLEAWERRYTYKSLGCDYLSEKNLD